MDGAKPGGGKAQHIQIRHGAGNIEHEGQEVVCSDDGEGQGVRLM